MNKTLMCAALAAVAAFAGIAAEEPCECPFAVNFCSARTNDCDVCGLRLNLLAGRDRSVSFVDIGTLACLVDEDAAGLQLAGLYNHIGNSPGLAQIAGLYNRVDRDAYGLQLSILLNRVDGSLGGMNLAVVNTAKSVTGLQIGVVNRAKALSGMQIGLVNFASDAAEGVQIGLVNIMQEAKFPVCPVLNVGF